MRWRVRSDSELGFLVIPEEAIGICSSRQEEEAEQCDIDAEPEQVRSRFVHRVTVLDMLMVCRMAVPAADDVTAI